MPSSATKLSLCLPSSTAASAAAAVPKALVRPRWCFKAAPTLSKQQSRAFARSPILFKRLKESGITLPVYAQTLSSSSSKTGFVSWYLGKLQYRPVLTKSITASLIYTAANLTSQEGVIYKNLKEAWIEINREQRSLHTKNKGALEDKSFTFILKTPPVSVLLLKAADL